MITTPIGQSTSALFEQKGFTALQIYQMVTQLNPAFAMKNMTLEKLMIKLSEAQGMTQTIKAGGRKYKFPRMGNNYLFAVSSSASRSNANLTVAVTLTQNDYASMGRGSIIQDAVTGVIGTILTVAPGIITVSYQQDPLGNGSFTASDFAQGNQIKYLGYSGGTRKYEAQNYVAPIPYYDEYQIGNFSADAEILAEDAHQQTQFKFGGKDWYVATQEIYALQQMEAAKTNWYMSDAAEQGGDKPKPASYINQIKTRNGMIESKTGDWAVEDFEDMLDTWTSKGSVIDGEVFCLAGTAYARNVSRVLKPMAQTAGVNTILGKDAFRGLNIKQFDCSGITVNLMVEQYFNNTQMNGGGYKDSAMWFSPKASETAEGLRLAPIVDLYYGEPGLKRTVVRGKTDENGNRRAEGSNDQPFTQITFELDSTKVISDTDKFIWHKGQY